MDYLAFAGFGLSCINTIVISIMIGASYGTPDEPEPARAPTKKQVSGTKKRVPRVITDEDAYYREVEEQKRARL